MNKDRDTIQTLGKAFGLSWKQAEQEFYKLIPVPEGWLTVGDYAKMKGISPVTAGTRLRQMFKKGVIDRKLHPSPKGAPYIYRPVKKK